MPANQHCALARANRVFCTDEKRIRTEHTVMDKSNNGLGCFLQIAALPQRRHDLRRNELSTNGGRKK